MKIISDVDLDCFGGEFRFEQDEFECKTTKNDKPVILYFNVKLEGYTRVRRYYPDMPDEYDNTIDSIDIKLSDAFYDDENCDNVCLLKDEVKRYEADLKYEIEQMLE